MKWGQTPFQDARGQRAARRRVAPVCREPRYLRDYALEFGCAIHAYCLMTNHVGGALHSCLVPTEAYVLACYRYIELNPVRARMVSAPEEYPWSSFGRNMRCAEDGLITRHAALPATAGDYRSLFDVPLEKDLIDEIRKATRNGRRLGVPAKPRGRRPKEA